MLWQPRSRPRSRGRNRRGIKRLNQTTDRSAFISLRESEVLANALRFSLYLAEKSRMSFSFVFLRTFFFGFNAYHSHCVYH